MYFFVFVVERLCSCVCVCAHVCVFIFSISSVDSKLKGSRKSGKVKFVTPTDDTTSAAACEPGDSVRSEGGKDVTVDFGSVAVGTIAEKWIEITNVSPVSTCI